MISIRNKFYTHPGSNCDYYASSDGQFAWFLCTWHPEKDVELEEIQAEIKLELINAEPLGISKMEIESWLKSFFAEYHWKLHARLRKSNLMEKGISLFFGALYGNELYYVQFGRIFCGLLGKNGTEIVGKNWKHYHVKTSEELEMLGFAERDIRVKCSRVLIDAEHSLIVVPSVIATKLFDQLKEHAGMDALLDSFSGVTNPMWLVLEGKSDLAPKKRKKLSRLQISSIVLIFITILAILYISFGNRFFDTGARKLKMIFQSQKAISMDKLPKTLNLDNTKVMDILDKVVNSPARTIQCEISWSTDLDLDVTASPAFDLNRIYLASGTNLKAYNKKEHNMVWDQELSAPIVSLTRTQYSLVAILEDKSIVGLNEDGTIGWKGVLGDAPLRQEKLHPIELTNAEDARLNSSVIVIPDAYGISVLDSNRGEAFSHIRLKQKLVKLSEYDKFDTSFYAITEKSLVCIKLNIIN